MALERRRRARDAVGVENKDSRESKEEAGEPISKKANKQVQEWKGKGVAAEQQCGSRRPKRAAAASCLKEEDDELADIDCQIAVKQAQVADQEVTAVLNTASLDKNDRNARPIRRLVDFIVHDENGKAAPMECVDSNSLYITGLVCPFDGPLDKQLGLHCEGFGEVVSWSITGYEDGNPILWLTTEAAEYVCEKPAGEYRRHFDALHIKATVCVEVYRALSKPDGGDPDCGIDDLLARVSRALAIRKQRSKRTVAAAQNFSRDYILSLGSLVWNQLTGLDELASDGEQLFTGLPALVALKDAADAQLGPQKDVGSLQVPGALSIREGGLLAGSDPSFSNLTEEDVRVFQKFEKKFDNHDKKRMK